MNPLLYSHHVEDEANECDNSQKNEPNPQEYKDFLIENIDWQNTFGVMSLNAPGVTIFPKSTFCYLKYNVINSKNYLTKGPSMSFYPDFIKIKFG